MARVELKNRDAIPAGEVERFVNRVLEKAEYHAEKNAENKGDFNQGVAQGYTEILDVITFWLEDNFADATIDLSEWAVKNLA